MAAAVDQEAIRRFELDGVAHVPNLVSAAAVEGLRRDLEAYLTDGAALTEGDTVLGLGLHAQYPAFRELAMTSLVPRAAACLMRTDRIQFLYDQLIVKEAGSSFVTPWHQDLPYWDIDGGQIIAGWVALDDVTIENGAVEYVKGSHRWGKLYSPPGWSKGLDDAFSQTGETLEPLPDIDARRDEYEITHFDLRAGDCVFHDSRTVHGAPGNSSAVRRRRAISVRYFSRGTCYVGRRQGGFHLVTDPAEQVTGTPLSEESFPVVPLAAATTGADRG